MQTSLSKTTSKYPWYIGLFFHLCEWLQKLSSSSLILSTWVKDIYNLRHLYYYAWSNKFISILKYELILELYRAIHSLCN